MTYGRNLPWRAALQGRLRITTRITTGGTARCYSGVSSRRGGYSLLEARWPGPSQNPVATITTKQLWEGFGDAALKRGFVNSAVQLKGRPPQKDEDAEEQKDAVEEEVEEESKRKSNEGGAKVDSGKERSGEGAPSPGEILKGGAGAGGRGGASNGGDGSSGNGGGGRRRGTSDRALQKPTVPDIYPQVMALPIAGRPLFPGFYKAVTVRNPAVAAAIQEMMKRGQPYIGAFLFKEENSDRDTIDSLDEVHEVGVFAQITSAFPVHGEEGSLTAVLYPHRRIKISQLLPQEKQAEEAKDEVPEPIEEFEEVQESENRGDVVASFEEEAVEKRPSAAAASAHNPYATAFLKKYKVSIVDVENLVEQPYDKKSPLIRAVTSEIVNVFKEVANLNPLFRDQISTFSMSQSAGNVIDEPAKLADFAAAVSAGEFKELQDVLETLGVEERLQKALVVLKKELMNAQLQSKISKDVEAKIQKRQREYWLMEQMKGIRRELGIESDGKDKLVERFKEKADKLAMPEAVKKVFDEVRCFS